MLNYYLKHLVYKQILYIPLIFYLQILNFFNKINKNKFCINTATLNLFSLFNIIQEIKRKIKNINHTKVHTLINIIFINNIQQFNMYVCIN